MLMKTATLFVLFVILLVPAAAQDKLLVSIISYIQGSYGLTEAGIQNTLVSYGFLEPPAQADAMTFEEKWDAFWATGRDEHLENNALGVDFSVTLAPDFDLATLSTLVDQALDEEPDVVIALSAPIAQTVLNITQNMEDPPVVMFAAVYNPFESGLGQAPCIKDDNVIGIYGVNPYDDIVALIVKQNPAIQTIGTLYNSSVASGVYGAEEIRTVAEGMGLHVETTAVTSIADLRPAAEGLASKGVEAIVMPDDLVSRAGIQVVVNATIDDQIPIFYSGADAVVFGATVGAGFDEYFLHGVELGLLLASYLNGELDPATTAISEESGRMVYGVNTTVAAMQEIEIPPEMLDNMDLMANPTGSGVVMFDDTLLAETLQMFNPMTVTERMEMDAAFLDRTVCTNEMIAEQQAELDAMDG